jgi:hypothetical protein
MGAEQSIEDDGDSGVIDDIWIWNFIEIISNSEFALNATNFIQTSSSTQRSPSSPSLGRNPGRKKFL